MLQYGRHTDMLNHLHLQNHVTIGKQSFESYTVPTPFICLLILPESARLHIYTEFVSEDPNFVSH